MVGKRSKITLCRSWILQKSDFPLISCLDCVLKLSTSSLYPESRVVLTGSHEYGFKVTRARIDYFLFWSRAVIFPDGRNDEDNVEEEDKESQPV